MSREKLKLWEHFFGMITDPVSLKYIMDECRVDSIYFRDRQSKTALVIDRQHNQSN